MLEPGPGSVEDHCERSQVARRVDQSTGIGQRAQKNRGADERGLGIEFRRLTDSWRYQAARQRVDCSENWQRPA